MLSDRAFLDSYIQENNSRLQHSYALLTAACDRHGIPYVPAAAAMFLWVDLRQGLLHHSWEGEMDLWSALNDSGVLLTPGKCGAAAMYHDKAGACT